MATLSEIRERTGALISKHWDHCEAHGLPHNETNKRQVQAALAAYYDDLGQLAGSGDRSALEDVLKRLYAELDTIDLDSILETDERELLVPLIIEGVEAAGFDPDDWPDREPGGEYRNF